MKLMQYLLLILLVFFSGKSVLAQPLDAALNKKYIAPLNQTNPLFGQDHAYTLTLRGNGETVVTARIVVSNNTDLPLSNLTFTLAKTLPQDITGFQVFREPACIRYDSINEKQALPPVCIQYQEADYFQYWYGNTRYQKTRTEFADGTITVILPQPIAAGKSGSILLYFRTPDYTNKDMFGAYHFSFETLKISDTLANVRVGINADDDLVLDGAQGKTEYGLAENATTMLKTPQAGMLMADSRIDSLYQQIGYGQLSKSATNLQPFDTYTVKGSYADTVWKLYAKHLLLGLVVSIGIVVLLVFIGKKSFHLLTQKSDKKQSHLPLLLTSGGVGFSSALFTTVYTVVLLFSSQLLNLYWYGSVQMVVMLLTLIISLGVYCLLLFGPALVIGIKKHYTWGIATFAATILWLVVDLFIVLLITVLIVRSPGISYPIPFMEHMLGASANGAGNVKATPSSISFPTNGENQLIPPSDVSKNLERM